MSIELLAKFPKRFFCGRTLGREEVIRSTEQEFANIDEIREAIWKWLEAKYNFKFIKKARDRHEEKGTEQEALKP